MMMLRPMAAKRPLLRKIVPFIRDESGVMAPQILFFFFLMLLVGGVAVDMMRFESKRVALQQTMDRATLAAASLENSLVPLDVVNSYFDTAGLDAELGPVQILETQNGRTVRAQATVHSDNYFMSMMDVPYLEADNRSQAEQRINDIEIMLVLDISGSMGSNHKIDNLKVAAKDFIDTVTANDAEGRISIGIVPYNAQVNLGGPLRSKYNATNVHGVANSNCLELPSSVFSSLALSRTLAIPMMADADVTSTTSKTNGFVSPTGSSATPATGASYRWCTPSTKTDVTLPTKNKTTLKAGIDDLVADGNTSILLGMRWATALLDPAATSVYNELIGAGQMDASMSGRPYSYASNDAMKVIVLMTDGEHVAHNRVVDAYKTGTSPIYKSTGDGNYSLYIDRPSTTSDYWVPHRASGVGEWRTAPWNSGSGVQQQTWQQVWKDLRVTYVAWQLYARAIGGTNSSARTTAYNNQMNIFLDPYASVGEMNTRLSNNCTAARAQGVLIYGIAFEAPATGQAAISDCASKPSSTYYFNASGLDIQTAFQLIASNLSQLRLTQ